ncbi:hypothetical protein [Desulfotruncus alcoholivorax]|uniref:hypothetical protein n=1 Tax=Desulfotruncus alcoholivorax TaxID=265477 RepID=UPI0003F97420|nr:hypothetical protein [Desulfotruncus alcoholivorax]
MEFKIAPEGLKLRDIDLWGDFYESYETGKLIEAEVVHTIREDGEDEGWELAFDDKPGITGICTFSESGLPERSLIDCFTGQVITCKVTKVDKKNLAVYVSRKDIVESNLKKLLNQLAQGEVIPAIVRAVKRNVYVDIGGGVIVKIPQEKAMLSNGVYLEDQYKEGSQIGVIVTQLDKSKKTIVVDPVNPWEKQKYNRGESVSGRVVAIKDNQAFIEVKPGMIGLAYYKSNNTYKVGESVKFQVLSFDPENRRLHLIYYNSRRISDRRRERAKKRSKRRNEITPGGNEIRTLGGFDKAKKIAAGNIIINELADINEDEKKAE